MELYIVYVKLTAADSSFQMLAWFLYMTQINLLNDFQYKENNTQSEGKKSTRRLFHHLIIVEK